MNAQELNRRVTLLRDQMEDASQAQAALQDFFPVHAMLHTASIDPAGSWSYEDEVFNKMSPEIARRLPTDEEHSPLWCLWHIARIEDMTMNRLVAGAPQLFWQDGWQARLNDTFHHSGNSMDAAEILLLSQTIDLEALRAYRLAVGLRTRAIVRALSPADLTRNVDSQHIAQVRQDKAVLPEADGVVDYWSKRTIAGLLLMPATRHPLTHLNEAQRLAKKRSARA
jgi:hypothetical protein